MSVQELIDELNKVKNKELDVQVNNHNDFNEYVTEVHEYSGSGYEITNGVVMLEVGE